MQEDMATLDRSVHIRPVSPPFDPDAHTLADVVLWGLETCPHDRHRVWYINEVKLGTDLGIAHSLRDLMRGYNMRVDGPPVVIRLGSHVSHYLRMGYAIAAHGDGLAWPLWDDRVFMQRLRKPGVVMPHFDHLVGLRSGREVRFWQLDELADEMKRGNTIEPAFRTQIRDMDTFTRRIAEVAGTPIVSAPVMDLAAHIDQRRSELLPIIDLETYEIDRSYGVTFAAFERHMSQRERLLPPISEEAGDARKSIREFIHSHPWLPLSDVEMYVRAEHGSVDPDGTMAFARAEYAAMEREIGTDAYGTMQWMENPSSHFQMYFTVDSDPKWIDKMVVSAERAITDGRVSDLDARAFYKMIDALKAVHARYANTPALHAERTALVQTAFDADYRTSSKKWQTPTEIAVLAAVRRRPPNPLVDMYREALRTIGWDAHPSVLAASGHAAIDRGGVSASYARQFRQLVNAMEGIHKRYPGTEQRSHRINAISAALTASGADEARAAAIAVIGATTATTASSAAHPRPAAAAAAAAARGERQSRWSK